VLTNGWQMRPLPHLCETCRGKKRPLARNPAPRNFLVDAVPEHESRWSCGKHCARRKRARLANRGVESRIVRFKVERVDLKFLGR